MPTCAGSASTGTPRRAPQSQRDPDYAGAVERLSQRGLVYECFCTRRELAVASAPHGTADDPPAYPGTCRSLTEADRERLRAEGRRPSLRVRMPEEPVPVSDRVHGQRPRAVGGDVVVRRSDGLHSFHQLAVVVDDAGDGVTDVCRGDDLLGLDRPSGRAGDLLGLAAPAYAHVPLVLGPDGRRLAKRHGAVSLRELRAAGVTQAALVGVLAWSSGIGDGSSTEPAGLVDGFDIEQVSRQPWRLTSDSLRVRSRSKNAASRPSRRSPVAALILAVRPPRSPRRPGHRRSRSPRRQAPPRRRSS